MTLSRRAFLSAFATAFPSSSFHYAALPQSGPHQRGTITYTCRVFPADGQPDIEGVRHEVWTAAPPPDQRRGDVIVLHEITGASVHFFAYTDTLVQNGYTVHCPVFFGDPFIDPNKIGEILLAATACGRKSDFRCRSLSPDLPVNRWLTALATDIAGGSTTKKLGAIGMCLTGIQPLAMLACKNVVAPVLCQPTLPLTRLQDVSPAVGPNGRRVPFARTRKDPVYELDFGLSDADIEKAHARVFDENLRILFIRYVKDPISSAARAARIQTYFRGHVDFVPLTGPKGNEHSSLVHTKNETARNAVLQFLNERL